MSTQALMVLGTASHVGKSLLVAALCRILADRGYRVAPFKAQNMSLNSAPTADGLEIGRAQAMQAEAARIVPSVDMNPILLKPIHDTASQVVLLGKVHGVQNAADYHRQNVREYFPIACEAYERLAKRYDIVVIEGAGSPAEFNLKDMDIVNMRMAAAARARCVLVGDIDRGGVFASLLGTLQLLEPHERSQIHSYIINKFRGDSNLLMPGVKDFSARIGLPCSGVVPWLSDVGLDEEDGVSDQQLPRAHLIWRNPVMHTARALRVAILALPQISNATDFAAFQAEAGIDWACAEHPADLEHADVVMLPGTKTTLDAITWLHEHDMFTAVRAFAKRGIVFGICGGLQILGETVEDPYGVEGGGSAAGLGLVALHTTLQREKITQRVRCTLSQNVFDTTQLQADGYEIHMGVSHRMQNDKPFCTLMRDDGTIIEDGVVSQSGTVAGTYVHGLFANDDFRHAFMAFAYEHAGLAPPKHLADFSATREARFDRMAAHFKRHLDVHLLLP